MKLANAYTKIKGSYKTCATSPVAQIIMRHIFFKISALLYSMSVFTYSENRFWVIFWPFPALLGIPVMINRADWPLSFNPIFHAIIVVFIHSFARVLEENKEKFSKKSSKGLSVTVNPIRPRHAMC